MKHLKETIRYWLLPDGVADTLRKVRSAHPKNRILCGPNTRFKNMYQGERCFILCNGPSVLKQDLSPLKSEIVFSVSNGYLHKDYLAIQPKYHCIAQLSYNKYMRPDDIITWFKEMHPNLGTAELFLNVSEEPMIRKNRLFSGRKINYFYSGFSRNENHEDIIDISKMVPSVTTVPVLCMMIAMYMGFNKIYLLGVDNDFWKIKEYKYSFEPTILKGKDISADSDGKLSDPMYYQFSAFATLLKQYWHMHNIARSNNISIFNATAGGALEEFERAKFESLF